MKLYLLLMNFLTVGLIFFTVAQYGLVDLVFAQGNERVLDGRTSILFTLLCDVALTAFFLNLKVKVMPNCLISTLWFRSTMINYGSVSKLSIGSRSFGSSRNVDVYLRDGRRFTAPIGFFANRLQLLEALIQNVLYVNSEVEIHRFLLEEIDEHALDSKINR